MAFELDHVFLLTDAGAPVADALVAFGFREGLPNRHPGQGTECRRFSFINAMIEFVWVCDPLEAQSERTRRTLLWERWYARQRGASPIGLCFRPGAPEQGKPFRHVWEYRPDYLPSPLAFQIGETDLKEPMWVYLDFLQRSHREENFVEHPNGARAVTKITVTSPVAVASPLFEPEIIDQIVNLREGNETLLEVWFDNAAQHRTLDLRPDAPLVLHL
jgi:hypothetical protein